MADEPEARRSDFLLDYYKVLWDNINRHIQGVWQTVTTLGVSVALLTLVGDGDLELGMAVALIVGVCAWYTATVYDSALWFARNQVIATRIERLFLRDPEDKELVQPYFTTFRESPLIGHFRNALWLSRGLVAVSVAYHFVSDVYPNFSIHGTIDLVKIFPYVATVGYLHVGRKMRNRINTNYTKMTQEKPKAVAPKPEGK